MTHQNIGILLLSNLLNEGEKHYLRHEYGHPLGSFYSSLMVAIRHADLLNLSRLEQGFPQEVRAHRDHINGRLRAKCHAILNNKPFARGRLDGRTIVIHEKGSKDKVLFVVETDPFPENLAEYIERKEEVRGIFIENWLPKEKIFTL